MKKSVLFITVFAVASVSLANTSIVKETNNKLKKSSSSAVTYDSSKGIIKRLQREMKHN